MLGWFLTAVLSFIVAVAQPAGAQDSTSPIVGVWKLTSYTRKEVGTEKTVQPMGEHPTGYRVMTRGGHAFYMFFAGNRKAPAGAITDADRIDLFKTMLVAGGTYKVEGNKVFFQGDVSTSQTVNKFTYEFEITGSELKMTAGPFKDTAGGPDTVVVTTYDRVE
jgi:hypothetical protein